MHCKIQGMNIELVKTKDGSDSLLRTDIQEHYHSTFGAIQESEHIFIKNGLLACSKKELQIFEMGMGTGLNVFLSWIRSKDNGMKVRYYSIEKYPVSPDIAMSLNYPDILDPAAREVFNTIHLGPWNQELDLGHFKLHKIHSDILSTTLPQGNDLIYFDAFSPEKEPDLWTDELFGKVYSSMNSGGILMTYSAKGEVRRKLIASGFRVEKLQGPPGKHHILRVSK